MFVGIHRQTHDTNTVSWLPNIPCSAGFRLFRFRSPLLSESLLLSFPPGTEMVHFPGFASLRLCIQRRIPDFESGGFPHSEIPGSLPACGSPRLIAACHVLHRLLAPRHPPYALSSLTTKLTQRLTSSHCSRKTTAPLWSRLRCSSEWQVPWIHSKIVCTKPSATLCDLLVCPSQSYSVFKKRCG